MSQTELKLSSTVLVLCCAALFASCPLRDQKSSQAVAPEPDVTRVDQSRLMEGGQINLPLTIKPDDPALAHLDFTEPRLFALARCIAVPVIRHDAAGVLSPGLASSWTSMEDGSVWELEFKSVTGQQPEFAGNLAINHFKSTLRGTRGPMRAQLEHLLAGAAAYANGSSDMLEGMTLDGTKLTVRLNLPFMQFPLWLGQPGLMIRPAETLEAAAGKPGLGMFVVSSVQGGAIQLTANPDSIVSTPRLDSITWLCEPDRETQLEQYKQGKLHACTVPPWEIPGLEKDPVYSGQLNAVQSSAVYLGCFDLHEFPWGDSQFQSKLGLRQAVNWSLDRDYLETSSNGSFKAWPYFFPECFKETIVAGRLKQPLYPLTVRKDLALQGLLDADHEAGIKLIPGMDLAWLDHEPFEELAYNILDYWIEITVKMRPLPDSREVLYSRIDEGKHEIILRLAYPAWPDPLALAYPVCHSALSGSGGNWSLLDDPELDSVLESAMQSAGTAERTKYYQQMESRLEDKALFVFLGYHNPRLLISPELGGYHLNPYDFDGSLGGQDFSTLGLAGD